MTTSSTDPKPSAPASPMLQDDGLSQLEGAPRINWTVIVLIALLSAVVLLVGLPVGAVLVMNSTGCCLVNGPEKVITFWASMIAGFLALFGMVVTGVFVITAFRVDATARAQARLAARKEVWNYITQYEAKLALEIEELKKLVPQVKERSVAAMKAFTKAEEDVKKLQHEVVTAIAQAQSETASAADEAQRAIGGVQEETINTARQAQEAIGGARVETANAAEEAQRAVAEVRGQTIDAASEVQEVIFGARQEVERQRTEAISAIDSAREEVETAVQAARDRIDRAGGAPEGEGGSD